MTTFELTAGPDAGRRVTLGAGQHLLGRARHCSLVVHDPAIEAHHLLVRVSEEGAVGLLQLAGRAPVGVDGVPAGAGPVECWIEVGSSRIDVVTGDASPDAPGITVDAIDISRCDDVVSAIADASRRGRLRERTSVGGTRVSLGIGDVRVPIDLVDASGVRVDPASLPLGLQPVIERASHCSGLPVVFDAGLAGLVGTAGVVVGIVDDHPQLERARSVARSIATQLARGGAHDSMPALVIAAPGDPALDQCTALLEIGARWRGRWTPDTSTLDGVTRLHVAGCRASG